MSLRHQYLINAADDALVNSKKSKAFRIMEIGCNDALRGRQIVDRAAKCGRKVIEYFGFDLFESVDASHIYNEAATPFRVIELETVKSLIAKTNKVSVIKLFKGDSKTTLPENIKDLPEMNIIFVRGGHSLPTIQSDVEYALKVAGSKTELVIDNYYPGDYTKGCAFLVDNDLSKRPDLSVQVTEQSDKYEEAGLTVKLVRLKKADKSDNAKVVVDVAPEYIPVEPPPAPAPETKKDVEPISKVSDSVCDTDVQPTRLCTESCPLSSCEHTQQPCDGSRRCESRVETVHLELPTAGPVAAPQVSEELVSSNNERSGKRKRRSRRSSNKRSGASSETADSESDDELSNNG